MGKRKNDTLKRRRPDRDYRDVCWISAEGDSERDYLRMGVFKGASVAVRFPKDIHPSRRDPVQVLKRLKKAVRQENFRKGDEAWIIVDDDVWEDANIEALLSWAEEDSRHHLAITNPKFELFLVMHYERGNGCTTFQSVDAALKRHWPRYDKRIPATQFTVNQVRAAIANARIKRAACTDARPAPGMTDMHLLVERLLGEGS